MSIKKQNLALKTLGLFSIIFLIAGILLFLVALAHYWQVTLKERTDFKNGEISNVLNGRTAIEQKLAGVVSDINFLAAYGQFYETRNGEAYSLFDDTAEQDRTLTRFLRVFSTEKKAYDQIRFLGPTGNEKIRINYNEGQPYPVAHSDLQEKSSRYYFQEIKKLKKEELYISPLDLNIEKGEIELPYKPVMRLAKPVYNARDEHKGSLLLNVMGEELLQAFHNATSSGQDHIMLLNKEGYWISSPDKSQEWGFMFGNTDNFAKAYPFAWQQLISSPEGQINNATNLITYTTVSPLPEAFRTDSTPNWKVVSIVPHSHPALQGAFGKYRFLYGSILLLLAFGSWVLASTISRHRQSELQVEFEQRFRQVLEHVDLLAVGMDSEGTVSFCNEALAELIGWNRQEILGKNWFQTCVAKEHRREAIRIIDDLKSGLIDEMTEDSLIETRAGEQRKIEWNHTLMKDPEGKIIGITCIGENVTDIREQEKQVLTLSRAVEQSPIVVMIVDTHGCIQYVNPRFTEVTGYSTREVIGQNPSILRSRSGTEDEQYVQLWETIRSGETWHGIFRNQKKNGDTYWASASISALRDGDGKIVNYIGVQEDITERLNLEHKFRMSVEGSPYAMVMIDAQGRIILANSKTEEYFGYEKDELMGETVELLLPDEYKPNHPRLRNQYAAESSTHTRSEHGIGRELSGRRKNGSIFPVEIALNQIKSEDGMITLASIMDITRRRELESELKQRNHEVARSKTLAIVGRMASMVAHDLRNPLSSIKMSLQILSKPDQSGPEEYRRELKAIALEQVSYMENNLNDLLNYARPPALKPQWLDLENVLNETINMLQAVIQKYDANIHVKVQKGLPTLYADPTKLRLIMSNLISNAIQTSAETGHRSEVFLEAMSRLGAITPMIQIEITDNGPGIDEETVEQLFEPFYTTRAQGTGLGLAIVKGFIEQHHGEIYLHSNPDGKGTLCMVLLPISMLTEVADDTKIESGLDHATQSEAPTLT